jgi:hypothetical protein
MEAPDSAVKRATSALRLISSKSAPVKAQPPQVIVEPREAISYRFDVVRDDFGQIFQIIMTPIPE